jgi:GGDEF domain-containing protein
MPADAAAGFVSRSYFSARFSTEILRAQRQGHALTLVLVDPDAGGETASPEAQPAELCRRVLAEVLSAQLRGFDVVAQWTDTTVAVLLLDSDRIGAAAVLQRLANAMAGPHLPGRRLCLRAGIAMYPRDGRTAHDLWARALVSLRGVRPA